MFHEKNPKIRLIWTSAIAHLAVKSNHKQIASNQSKQHPMQRVFEYLTTFHYLKCECVSVAHLFVSNVGNSVLLFHFFFFFSLAADDFSTASAAAATCQLSKISQSKIFNKVEKGQRRRRRRSADVPHTYLFIYFGVGN